MVGNSTSTNLSSFDFQATVFAEAQRVGLKFNTKRGVLLTSPFARQWPLFCIEKGAAHAYIDTDAGRQTIRLGYPGELLSALPGFLIGKPSALGIEVIRRCEGYSITREQLTSFLENNPALQNAYTRMLEGFVCGLMARELDLLEPSPRARYNTVLKRSPKVFQHIPLKYIASYLRMTPETLSRIRANS